ncbi:hypothetical protein K435DRAFT_878193 [Dendrothele bispora CBS 962.96]|uniref:Uncharacterized protein n=1 Tax=Dendrothele bispora (strain CBS 962.96) TaxID=1314807 RepID=A0A4S8KNL5_DENBC|nr:hypothetical protein K435DRAFT_878193 [Dendrothele bispora CBS 962.96]
MAWDAEIATSRLKDEEENEDEGEDRNDFDPDEYLRQVIENESGNEGGKSNEELDEKEKSRVLKPYYFEHFLPEIDQIVERLREMREEMGSSSSSSSGEGGKALYPLLVLLIAALETDKPEIDTMTLSQSIRFASVPATTRFEAQTSIVEDTLMISQNWDDGIVQVDSDQLEYGKMSSR